MFDGPQAAKTHAKLLTYVGIYYIEVNLDISMFINP